MPTVFIPDEIYNAFILRSGKSVDVEGWIQNIVEDFLDRTKFDGAIWPIEYLDEVEGKEAKEWEKKYGDPEKGFQWKALFLPNGTLIKMPYKDQDFIAEVRHQFIHFAGKTYNSPSLLASRIASSTSRNAWRDFYIKRPKDDKFAPASFLRRQNIGKNLFGN
ncbi:MAG: hypothetical protein IIB64_06125 [Proteobacteria bacterium]|nr:hypothetical protein [Pseudomonadota bacterium]